MNDHILIEVLDKQFKCLHFDLSLLIRATPLEALYRADRVSKAPQLLSVGESVLRCAAVIEQTFGGITASLWDDPFEWTLPENLSTTERVIEYLDEVEATRRRAFQSFSRDSDLFKEVQVPDGTTRPLIGLLLETLARASTCHGRALVISRLASDAAGSNASP